MARKAAAMPPPALKCKEAYARVHASKRCLWPAAEVIVLDEAA
jgi:hypothetical protein